MYKYDTEYEVEYVRFREILYGVQVGCKVRGRIRTEMAVELSDCESCTMTTVQEEAWQLYGDYGEADYPSMKKEGIFALKALEGGKWMWSTKSPGPPRFNSR